jgi:hypothetical protein
MNYIQIRAALTFTCHGSDAITCPLTGFIYSAANISNPAAMGMARTMILASHVRYRGAEIISCEINYLTQKNNDVRIRGIP